MRADDLAVPRVEHPDGALLEAVVVDRHARVLEMLDDVLDDVAVRAQHRGLAVHLLEEPERVGERCALGRARPTTRAGGAVGARADRASGGTARRGSTRPRVALDVGEGVGDALGLAVPAAVRAAGGRRPPTSRGGFPPWRAGRDRWSSVRSLQSTARGSSASSRRSWVYVNSLPASRRVHQRSSSTSRLGVNVVVLGRLHDPVPDDLGPPLRVVVAGLARRIAERRTGARSPPRPHGGRRPRRARRARSCPWGSVQSSYAGGGRGARSAALRRRPGTTMPPAARTTAVCVYIHRRSFLRFARFQTSGHWSRAADARRSARSRPAHRRRTPPPGAVLVAATRPRRPRPGARRGRPGRLGDRLRERRVPPCRAPARPLPPRTGTAWRGSAPGGARGRWNRVRVRRPRGGACATVCARSRTARVVVEVVDSDRRTSVHATASTSWSSSAK